MTVTPITEAQKASIRTAVFTTLGLNDVNDGKDDLRTAAREKLMGTDMDIALSVCVAAEEVLRNPAYNVAHYPLEWLGNETVLDWLAAGKAEQFVTAVESRMEGPLRNWQNGQPCPAGILLG